MAKKQLNKKYEIVLENQSILGEGPAWDAINHALLWVDIEQKTINRLDLATGKNQSVQYPTIVGSVVPRSIGGYAFATHQGIFALTADFKIGELLAPFSISSEEQINDGKCDAAGRYWTGTLALDRKSPIAALYCVDQHHHYEKKITGSILSNGIGWNSAQDKMYYIDTKKSCVFELNFNLATGEISQQRVLIDLTHYQGGPDGMTVDSEDGIWIAQWDSGEIHRYHSNGTLDFILPMPVKRVTSCCFGGADLTELYITSTRKGLTEAQLKEQPLSGSIFKVKVDIKGTSTNSYQG